MMCLYAWNSDIIMSAIFIVLTYNIWHDVVVVVVVVVVDVVVAVDVVWHNHHPGGDTCENIKDFSFLQRIFVPAKSVDNAVSAQILLYRGMINKVYGYPASAEKSTPACTTRGSFFLHDRERRESEEREREGNEVVNKRDKLRGSEWERDWGREKEREGRREVKWRSK